MAHVHDSRPARPPELFWTLRKIIVLTAVLGIFGFFAGWIVFYILTLGLNMAQAQAQFWLAIIPSSSIAFAFLASLFFAWQERRRLLKFYRG